MKLANLAVTALLFTLPAAAAPGDFEAVIDWSSWDAILAAHVADGRVDYDAVRAEAGLAVTVADLAAADLEGQEPDAVLSFYINAYNVLAVQGILDGHSPRTNLGKLRFFYWEKFEVAGERMTLNELEHERIRPLGEPRIHFAIVCASASCPRLRSEAYLPSSLDAQLDDAARRFINDSGKNRIDLGRGVAELSRIFKWFAEDFEAAAGGVPAYVAGYLADDRAARALRGSRLKVRHLDYDWSLNGTLGKDAP